MDLTLITLLVLGVSSVWGNPNAKALNPAAGLPFEELIQYYGYPVEVYEDIQTEDGYLLTMHRIPHGRNNANEPRKGTLLLMHCLTCSAAVFGSYGPEKSLAYILADEGYDVWMPNARGTYFSKKHTTFDPSEADFWKFSFHEIGYYDLPASIDFIQEKTGEEKIYYVGFSQGTTSYYILASERPEYNDIIKIAVTLAPSAYFANIANDVLLFASKYIDVLTELLKMLEWYEFLPQTDVVAVLASFCNGVGQEFCIDFFFSIFGMEADQLEQNYLPVFGTHYPAGCSSSQVIHYGQLIASGEFRQFDYGLVENLAQYGSATPPVYDLSKITSPVALFYAADDQIPPQDVEELAADLPNVVHLQLVDDPKFNHFDFVVSPNVVELVYNDVIDVLSKY